VPLYAFESPTVHPTAFVAPTASLIGDVTVEAGLARRYLAGFGEA
jgi:carbonic anhydrase/acetyltransferase-like protein (isoleucine patch superfamily)